MKSKKDASKKVIYGPFSVFFSSKKVLSTYRIQMNEWKPNYSLKTVMPQITPNSLRIRECAIPE